MRDFILLGGFLDERRASPPVQQAVRIPHKSGITRTGRQVCPVVAANRFCKLLRRAMRDYEGETTSVRIPDRKNLCRPATCLREWRPAEKCLRMHNCPLAMESDESPSKCPQENAMARWARPIIRKHIRGHCDAAITGTGQASASRLFALPDFCIPPVFTLSRGEPGVSRSNLPAKAKFMANFSD